MEQEIELSDYTTVHELGITETNSGDTKQSGKIMNKYRLKSEKLIKRSSCCKKALFFRDYINDCFLCFL